MNDTSTGCGLLIAVLLFAGVVAAFVEGCGNNKSTGRFEGMTQQERINKKWEMLNKDQNYYPTEHLEIRSGNNR